jgi:hypothetical protein
MYNDLISIIEGAAPTIAAALVPAPFGAPAGALATVAIAHLADGLGLPHPADPKDIAAKLSDIAPAVRDAVLSRADANFQTTLAPVTPAAGGASAPTAAPTPGSPSGDAKLAEPDVNTHHGVTMDLPSMVVFMGLSALSGVLASRGISLGGFSQAILGSSDLHIAAAMIAGTLTVAIRQVLGTNKNTTALASASKP